MTLFRNRNTYSEIPHKRFLELLEYNMALKLSDRVSPSVCRYVFSNYLKEKSNSYSAYSDSGIRSIERDLNLD